MWVTQPTPGFSGAFPYNNPMAARGPLAAFLLVLALPLGLPAAEVKTKGEGVNAIIPSIPAVPTVPSAANVPALIPSVPAPLGTPVATSQAPEIKAPPAVGPALPSPVIKEMSRRQGEPRTGAAAGEAAEKDAEGLTAAGRSQFDDAGAARSFWGGLKELILGPARAEAPPTAGPSHPVRSVEYKDRRWRVNGREASLLGFGSFKDAVVHPEDPGLAVKLFYRDFRSHSSLDEKREEVRNIRLLAPLGVVPRLIEQGGVALAGRNIGYVVQERVRGTTLETATPTKLREVRRLFDTLAAAGVEIADTDRPLKLRQNIMVGETDSGGFGAYLVDADLVKTAKSNRELKGFYDRVFASLASRQ